MIEREGNIWEYENLPNYVLVIPTCRALKKTGALVMGRGVAAQAKHKHPNLPSLFGRGFRDYPKKHFLWLSPKFASFQTKHKWWHDADRDLIMMSAMEMAETAIRSLNTNIFVLTRVGCGNGRLKWDVVKPWLKDLPDNCIVVNRRGLDGE